MKNLFLTTILLFFVPAFADNRKEQIEYDAINLVIEKYGKGLENRLKGTGVNASYRSWYENECFFTVAAGTFQEYNWSGLEWFSVNVCSDYAEIIEVNKKN